MVALACGMVLALEMVNTAIERVVDILSPEYNRQYGIVKNIMAGAVLVMAVAAAVIGGIVFLPPLLRLL